MNFFSLKNPGFNKKNVIFFLIFVFFSLLIPFACAKAGTGAATVLWALLWFIIPFGLISVVFAGLSQYLMDWVLDWDLTYTNPLSPDPAGYILKTGLDITLPLANIVILLAFLVIALATILRIETYGMKKLLPTLIIIALLINFAPTVLGVIMDGVNLLMKFFLNPLGGAFDTFSTFSKNLTAPLITSAALIASNAAFQDLKIQVPIAGGIVSAIKAIGAAALTFFTIKPLFLTIIISLFSLLSGMTFLCFAFLFIVRYFKIWIAVILSPVYIALYILPGTRKYFQQWWNDFIKWALIGIVGAFYLYIGSQIYKASTSLFPGLNLSGELGGISSVILPWDVLESIIVFSLPIVFLALAFLTTFQTAEAVYKAIESGVKTMIDFAKKTAFPQMIRKGWMARIERPRWKKREEGLPEVAARVSTGLRRIPFVRHMKIAEELERYGLEWEKKINTAKTKYQYLPSFDIAEKVATGDIPLGADAAAAIHTIVMRGDSQDIFRAFEKVLKVESDDDLLKDKRFKEIMQVILRDLYKGGVGNDVVRRDPRLAAVLAGKEGTGFDYTKQETPEEAIRRAVQEMRDSHLSAVEADVFRNEIVVDEFAKKKNADTYRTAIRTVKNFADVFSDTFKKIYEKSGKTPEDFRKEYARFYEVRENPYLKPVIKDPTMGEGAALDEEIAKLRSKLRKMSEIEKMERPGEVAAIERKIRELEEKKREIEEEEKERERESRKKTPPSSGKTQKREPLRQRFKKWFLKPKGGKIP